MKKLKLDIRTVDQENLAQFFLENNQPKFRAYQVYDWLWKHRQLDFDKMTNLSFKNRELLKQKFTISSLKIIRSNVSVDGTIKFLFNIDDSKVVEGVLIPQLNRLTACISSQVGCSLACTFCATGKLKLYRTTIFKTVL